MNLNHKTLPTRSKRTRSVAAVAAALTTVFVIATLFEVAGLYHEQVARLPAQPAAMVAKH